MTHRLRPMTDRDVHDACATMRDAFADLARKLGGESHWGDDLPSRYPRVQHLLGTDPGGAWVAEVDGRVAGVALALVRDGLWGLSSLVVLPEHQSGGVGRALLERTVDYGAGAAGGLILSSEDPRALRAYSRAGFALHPAMDATGPVRRRPAPEPAVRRGSWERDRELCNEIGRLVRGAGHGDDLAVYLSTGARLLVHDDGAFAVVDGAAVKVLAARAPELAAAVLRAVLREAPDGAEAEVEFITAGQEWAVATALDAGLELRPAGAVMVRGEVAPLAPYLPSGSYL